MSDRAWQVDQLLDAIELVKESRRAEARDLLRTLIREDNNFEDAWLWMSVAVDSLDQSALCLDNVLRINPRNAEAAASLARIRAPQMAMERRRHTLRFYRDMAIGGMWLLALVVLFTAFATIVRLGPG
jgi:hypothetical protein